MARNRIVLIGDSHVLASQAWWRRLATTHASDNYEVTVCNLPSSTYQEFSYTTRFGATEINPLIAHNLGIAGLFPLKNFMEKGDDENTWLIWSQGGALLAPILLELEQYDFAVPDEYGPSPVLQGRLLPFDAVVRRIDHWLDPIWRGLAKLMRERPLRSALLMMPAPHRQTSSMNRFMGETFDKDYDFPRSDLRLKIHRLIRSRFEAICSSLGMTFIDLSPLTTTSDGFLDERWGSDGFHGNVSYGGVVLMAIYDLLFQQGRLANAHDVTFSHVYEDQVKLATDLFALKLGGMLNSSEGDNRLLRRIAALEVDIRAKDELLALLEERYERAQEQITLQMKRVFELESAKIKF